MSDLVKDEVEQAFREGLKKGYEQAGKIMWMIRMEDVLNIVSKYCPDDDGSCSKAGVDLREMLDEIEGMPETEVQPVKHGRWIEIEPMLRLIEHIQMMLTTIYDTGGCIQSGDMKCLIETSDRLKELVKESGCYMREEGESDG